MEVKTKKAFESGKLHGVYRCGKREKLLRKIPQIEKLDMPDATGIIISGIMNFGNDSDTIRAMAKDAIGCDAEDIKIPYDESKFARQRFINEIIIGKLTGSIRFSVQSLIDTFYDFLDMPSLMKIKSCTFRKNTTSLQAMSMKWMSMSQKSLLPIPLALTLTGF